LGRLKYSLEVEDPISYGSECKCGTASECNVGTASEKNQYAYDIVSEVRKDPILNVYKARTNMHKNYDFKYIYSRFCTTLLMYIVYYHNHHSHYLIKKVQVIAKK